jgi:putative hydrolase of the HAD superfamily
MSYEFLYAKFMLKSFIFDLDNTLYPADASIWSQIDDNIKRFIVEFTGLPPDEAFRLQKQYYEKYGTTLNGLMAEHGIDPEVYLKPVHSINLDTLHYNVLLDEALSKITVPKYIFTSGTKQHAGRVLDKLRLTHHFIDVFDIRSSDFTPKPKQAAYEKFLALHPLNPHETLFVEDLPRNLEVPKAMGMATLLVQSPVKVTRESFEKAGADAPYIDHRTDNLAQFLLDRIHSFNNKLAF